MTPSEQGSPQFLDEVFPAELEEIARRRRVAATGQREPEPGPPDANRGLIGLALSGGGIRSATFALGVLQTLAGRRVLDRFDYLSTVSGGGFVGSCLSTVLNGPEARAVGARFPLRFEAGRQDTPAVRHLRNSGDYLAPSGLLDRFRLAAIVLRGILLNLLLFVPYVMMAVVLTEVVHELGRPLFGWFRLVPLGILGLFLALVATFPIVSKLLLRRLSWAGRNAYERLIARALLLALLVMALSPMLLLIGQAIDLNAEDVREWILYESRHSFEVDDPLHWLVPTAVLAALLFSLRAVRKGGRLRKVALYLLGFIGPALLFSGYLVMSVFEIDSPVLRTPALAVFQADRADLAGDAAALAPRLLERVGGAGVAVGDSPEIDAVAGGWQIVDSERRQVLKVYEDPAEDHFVVEHALDAELERGWFSPALMREFVERDLAVATDRLRVDMESPGRWQIVEETSGRFHHIVRNRGRLEFVDLPTDLWDQGNERFVLVGLGLLLFGFLFVNVNQTSSHGFYRDRLSRAYLLNAESMEPDDTLRLSEMGAGDSAAPYHLVNVALNLQGSADPGLRGRSADFFVFAKRYCGGPRTGYCPTERLEELDPHLDLATTMAISAAAASPNMGASTVRSLVFILTLLNIRLGYWLPNPTWARSKSLWKRMVASSTVGPGHLLREALGRLHGHGSFVNLSDGGHLENLGAYELLRRRCRLIVVVDAEEDAQLAFGGLVKLMRLARIDLGIDIEIDLNDLRRAEGGLSGGHWALGKIHYGRPDEDQNGYLVYLKVSVSGDENDDILEYRSRNPEFPHESTAGQFFKEDQFEAYRALGHHVTDGMIRRLMGAREGSMIELRELLGLSGAGGRGPSGPPSPA